MERASRPSAGGVRARRDRHSPAFVDEDDGRPDVTAPEVLDTVATGLVYVALATALLRWPGRTLGIGTALILATTVGLWAWWMMLAAVLVGTLGWRIGRRRTAGNGLLGHPPWAALVLATALAVLGGGPVRVAGLVGMVASSGWLLWRWRHPARSAAAQEPEPDLAPSEPPPQPQPEPEPEPAFARPGPAGRGGADPRTGPGDQGAAAGWRGGGPFGSGAWMVDFAPCERCGGILVGSGRADADARELVARATCTDCGLRLVGVVDPARPDAGIIWFQVPETWTTAEAAHR